MLIGTLLFVVLVLKTNWGFILLFVHLFVGFGLFFSFVHSITLKKEEKEFFFFSSFVLTHSVSLDSSDERNIAHTHTWRRERGERERERVRSRWADRHTHAPGQRTLIQCKNFPKMIGSSLPKNSP